MVRKTLHASKPRAVTDGASYSPAGQVVERPDGYHGIAADGRQEFGPFETFEQAQAAIDAVFDGIDGQMPAEADLLADAEAQVGIADWLDPETGEPAEGSCPPHLDAE